jgi:hypothetical protein
MLDAMNPRKVAGLLALLYALVTFGALFGQSQDDRIGGLLLLFVLVAGVCAAAIVRLRAVPMVILLWTLAAAQTLVMIALLAAHVGDPGVVAFLNVLLIAGMVFVAGMFGREAGRLRIS